MEIKPNDYVLWYKELEVENAPFPKPYWVRKWGRVSSVHSEGLYVVRYGHGARDLIQKDQIRIVANTIAQLDYKLKELWDSPMEKIILKQFREWTNRRSSCP